MTRDIAPTLMRAPKVANLRRARVQLDAIKEKMKVGTFSFLEEFPEYRYQDQLDEMKREQGKRLTWRCFESIHRPLRDARRNSTLEWLSQDFGFSVAP